MKKITVAFLAVVLALSLCLVACNDDPADVVTITVLDTLELKVGETPDFNGHVKVTVNGEEVTNPQVTCTLVDGNPNEAGRCTYRVTYTHNGTNYTKNGFVNFKADNVVLEGENFVQRLGTAIVWKDHVTVTVNGSAQSNPNLTAVVKSGTEGAEGVVVYTVTYTYEGKPYTTEVSVTYTNVDPDDTEILETLFKKEYDSYTVEYRDQMVDLPDFPIIERDKIVLGDTGSLVEIYKKNYIDNVEETSYISIDFPTDKLLYYFQSGSGADSWRYTAYSWENDAATYAYYWPIGYAPYDCLDEYGNLPVSKLYFSRESSTGFVVKNAYLTDVAEMLFYASENDTRTFTKIELETDGTYLTKVTGYYTRKSDSVSYDGIISFTWSNVNGTSVTLPEGATEGKPTNPGEPEIPEYTSPEQGSALTPAQTAALTEALAKTYTSVTYSYVNSYKIGEYAFTDTYSGKLTANATYDVVRQLAMRGDFEYYDNLQTTLFRPISSTAGVLHLFYNEHGDYYSQQIAGTVAKATYCVSFADFGFTADMFGATADGVYVVTADSLAAVHAKVSQIFGLTEFTSATVMTFTFKLDADNNVTEWYFLADCTDSSDRFYMQVSGAYENYDTTEIVIPGVFDTTEVADTAEIDAALNADYSNVTINEHGNGYTMYFVDNDIRVDGFDLSSTGIVTGTWSKNYLYKADEGKYYEILGGIETPREPIDSTADCVFYNVLKFDFALLQGHLKYNAATGTYICHVSDFADYDNDAFAFYWTGFFGETTTVTDIELTVDGGYVTGVRMYVTVTETDSETGATVTTNNTMSATLSNFGTTVFPEDGAAD
ncbi:MAG: hypothetical protein NC132_03515 [Corallococcus sp.]|nr:hypothetical protein [Corallococcus sp.]MCM1359570.1 hypothetical protein [Corallococcus sp.]MCM1395162.1 hypothetical protein [Corallococcus sp.]